MMTLLVKIVAILGGLLAAGVLYGITLQTMWTWFVVPQFGIGPLSFFEALGLGSLVGYVTYQSTPKDDTHSAMYSFALGVLTILVRSVLTLAFGAIYAGLR